MNEFFQNSIFAGAVLTLTAWEIGQAIQKRYQSVLLNPLFLAVILAAGVLKVFHITYENYYESAKYISYFLTPATVCLAMPLYDQLKLLRRNFRAAAAGIAAGTLTSLFSVFLIAKGFHLTYQEYVTLLPKSVTTAIGIEMSEEMRGMVSVTAAVIIMTGIFGSLTAEIVFKICRIKEAAARGTALGTAAHAVGTAKAMENGGEEGAMSSFALVASGLVTVVFLPAFSLLI